MATTTVGIDGLVSAVRVTLGTIDSAVLPFEGKAAHLVVIETQVASRKTGLSMT